MADKYINVDECREEFVSAVYDILNRDKDNVNANLIIDTFDDLPAADVQEVRHARWKRVASEYYCSNCTYSMNYITMFCPLCGARMDGETNE